LRFGAPHVIATEEEDVVQRMNEITKGRGARIIFDPVGGPGVEKLAQVAAYHGIIFIYGALSMQPTPFPMTAFTKGLSLRGYTLGELRQDPQLLETAKNYIVARLKDGHFHPKIAKTFPLAQSAGAYQYLASNQQVGKVVITV
jgi:NADPH:quinone reductase-like Zn-dependent oxidoreductase